VTAIAEPRIDHELTEPVPSAAADGTAPVDRALPAASTSGPDRSPSGALPVLKVAATTLSLLLLGFVAFLVLFSGLEHQSAQTARYATFRDQLAQGLVPMSGIDANGRPVALGTPIGLLQIPAIGVREVICQGTTAGVMSDCPGHQRSTVFPGQAGYSVIMGRRAAFGGPFKRLSVLDRNARITITTQEGLATYRVRDVRKAGDVAPPPPASGTGRLVLETATGSAFMPTGVLYVDADLLVKALPGNGASVSAAALPADERPLGIDTSTLYVLVLWLEALMVVVVMAVWSRVRWGLAQAVVVFCPVVLLIALFASSQVTKLFPNLT
jgi:sortase A